MAVALIALRIAPAGARKPSAPPHPPVGTVIATRAYENTLHDARAGVLLVEWSWAKHEGEFVIQDRTRTRTRTARMMGGAKDVFESSTDSTLLRTENGELLYMEELGVQGGRDDRSVTRRTPTGYEVRVAVGGNEEVFEIETPGPTTVDAEAFLGPKIRAGEAKPGSEFQYRVLAPGRRTSLQAIARVEAFDDEGPGLRVRVSVEGNDSLWWFAPDGSVMRLRIGDTVIRRADDLTFEDLPRRPAAYPITLSANIELPRLFTARTMIVDVDVETDDTVKPPVIPVNPFTEVVEKSASRVRLRLRSVDSPAINAPLPIAPDGFEEHLKATPVMEVDDPEVQAIARRLVADHKDARGAARAIAEFVFGTLSKGSSSTAAPTAKRILRDRCGDCSEHALLFTTLCRAAGIPARRCSGYVCIGGDWGGHAWCEIWVGAWIGADPTTNEIGTRARYIFCTRQDDREIRGASISAARTRIRIRKAEFSDGAIDLESETRVDRTVFTGIRLGTLPEGWRVVERRTLGPQRSIVSDTIRIDAYITPDQGYRSIDRLLEYADAQAKRTKLGGREAIVRKTSHNTTWVVPLGRQNLWIMATSLGAVSAEQIEALFQPTLARDDG